MVQAKSIETGCKLHLNPYFAKKEQLKTAFTIEQKGNDSGNVLLCEWGEDHCCIAGYDNKSKVVRHLEYLTFEQSDAEIVQEIIELLQKRNHGFSKIVFCSALPQSVLTPAKLYSQQTTILKSLYGPAFSNTLHDELSELQIVNVYAFPAGQYQKIIQSFPEAVFLHMYTTELKITSGFTEELQVTVHFTHKHFRVMVKRGRQIQLAQLYFYNASLDVVYYLLKVFEELNLNKEETHLILSGLIEEGSALSQEIESYFYNVHFALPSPVIPQDTAYPPHFFASIYKLALCVS